MSAHKADLPPIPVGGWRLQAVCTTHVNEMLWDERVDGETDDERVERHAVAKSICYLRCPVREQCGNSVDVKYDEGIRGGHRLPPLHGQLTPAEVEMSRLLRKGWPLDQAARAADRLAGDSKAS